MSWLLVAGKPDGEQGCGGGHQESQKKLFFIMMQLASFKVT